MVLQFKITGDDRWIFSIITPVFSVTWSFSWYADLLLKKHFFLLSMLKTVVLL